MWDGLEGNYFFCQQWLSWKFLSQSWCVLFNLISFSLQQADVSVGDSVHRTAWHYAAAHKRRDCINVLLSCCVSVQQDENQACVLCVYRSFGLERHGSNLCTILQESSHNEKRDSCFCNKANVFSSPCSSDLCYFGVTSWKMPLVEISNFLADVGKINLALHVQWNSVIMYPQGKWKWYVLNKVRFIQNKESAKKADWRCPWSTERT